MTGQFKLIGFDLDGTLVDSLPDLTLSVNSALAEFDLPQAPEALVLTWIGNGAQILIARALEWATAQSGKTLTEAQIATLKERFNVFYGENICNRSRLFPNVKDTLQKLKAKGYRLAVVTNKPTQHTRPVLKAFGIYLCGKFGLYPKQVLFVGDSRNDIIAAHNAGCPVVGLTYGYNYNIPIAESHPDWVFEDFAELLTMV